MGFKDFAIINCDLTSYIRPFDFEIESYSPFINLFLRKKSRFKIKCKNKKFKYFLEYKALSIFDEDMKTKNFTPRIFSQSIGSNNQIVIEFHLEFSEWVQIFEKVILFYKTIIDQLILSRRFISNDSYKL